jgi:hypothetical protein
MDTEGFKKREAEIYVPGEEKKQTLYERFGIHIGVPYGWVDLVGDLLDEVYSLVKGEDDFDISQAVTHKSGKLRIYAHGGTEAIWQLIRDAEARSLSICQYCGSPEGESVSVGREWIEIKCPVCIITDCLDEGLSHPGFSPLS